LFPAYFHGQPSNCASTVMLTLEECIAHIAAGTGKFINRKTAFRLNQSKAPEFDQRTKLAGGSMRDSWFQAQSGYAGPTVWQMPSFDLKPNSGVPTA
jgi:hypothetical protein